MTDIITDIMVEVLRIFGIATKELRRGTASKFLIGYSWAFTKGRIEKFLRKLAGMADLESALKKLDRLTQEEARMALAEVLRITHSVHDEVKAVYGKVENVGDKVKDVGERVSDLGEEVADLGDRIEDVGEKVEDIGNKVEDIGTGVDDVGDKVQSISEKVQVVIDGARRVSTHLLMLANMYTFRRQGSKSSSAGSQIDY
jgi:methyl-accepting chemotaxis protein